LINDIPTAATAYGPRKAKWVFHYKHGWAANQYNNAMINHHFQMASAFDNILPCSGFYNYKDPDMTCANNDDQWLAAYFSDVNRMKLIKGAYDPNDRFGIVLKGVTPPPPTPPPSPMPTPAPTPLPPSGPNLALNRPVQKSTATQGFGAVRAVDGNMATRWASAVNDPKESITVELDAEVALSRIDIYWHSDCAATYNIRGSIDGQNFYKIQGPVTGQAGLVSTTILASAPTTKFVRIVGLTKCNLSGGYSIYELEAYGAYV